MLSVREDFSLAGQVGTTTEIKVLTSTLALCLTLPVHKVDTGQPVLLGNPLCSQVLGHGDRIVTAPLHGGIICHHHALHPTESTFQTCIFVNFKLQNISPDPADPSDNASSRHLLFAIEGIASQLGQLKEWGARVQQQVYSLPVIYKLVPKFQYKVVDPFGLILKN